MTPIAIIGAAARFPGAADLDAYWRLMIERRHAITAVPKERWSHERFGHPSRRQPARSYTFAAGVVEGLDQFDASFFGISPREAEQIDPQQRWLLELAWEAIQDAGLRSRDLSSSGTGVYMGATGSEYGTLRLGDLAAGDGYFMTGNTTSIAANRISYIFDLHGPSFTVDTACSSSLVALDVACQDLRAGRTGAAIAGGVNILLTPYPFIGFSKASMLSPDGRCFAFDARANGYVRSEGAGVVVLKRLDDALAHGDSIRAVISGSGVNSDGRTMGLSMPNGAAQADLLRSVYDAAEVDPNSLGFIEAHGTGTPVGDPIELGALGDVLGARRDRALPVGSAKTNVGHLEVASGMAGLFKAMLSIERGSVPASLNFDTPNPHIDFDRLNIAVISEETHLDAGLRRAGINSFGFGGTNAHVILEHAPDRPIPAPDEASSPTPPLLISARSEAALALLVQDWRDRLAGSSPAAAADLLRAAARRRDHHGHRLALQNATAAHGGAWEAGSPQRAQNTAVSGKLAFVFSGNGSQWVGMGRAAFASNPTFAESLRRTDELLRPALEWSLVETLLHEESADRLARTDVAQPLLFGLQVAIVEALSAEGLRPDAVMGHSVGEIAAAWASGVLSLENAVRVVAARSRHQQRTHGLGRMAALALPLADALKVVEDSDEGLELCADNSASSVTVGGPAGAVDALRERAAKAGWRSTVLPLDYAFHTAVLDPVRSELLADLAGIEARQARLPMVSTVTGSPVEGRELDVDYWWRNIRDRVRFREAVDHLIGDGVRVFVEIGPQPVLQSYMREQLRVAETDGRLLRTLSRASSAQNPFPQIAAEAYAAGYDLASSAVFDGPAAAASALPKHPWRREAVWFRPTAEGVYPHNPVADHPLLGFRADAEGRVWNGLVDLEGSPWLRDHAVESLSVVPAAAIVETALAAARAMWPAAAVLEVRDLQVLSAMVVEDGLGRETRLRLEQTGRFELESRPRLGEGGWIVNAVGKVAVGQGEAEIPTPVEPVTTISASEVYAAATALSLDYGPSFRVVSDVAVGAGGDAQVRFVAETEEPDARRVIAIERLDGALQGFLALHLVGGSSLAAGESLLPERFGRVRVFAPFGRSPHEARIRIVRQGDRTMRGTLSLIDAAGRVLVTAEDCVFRRVHLSRPDKALAQTFRFVETPAPLAHAAAPIDVERLCAAVVPTQDVRLQELSGLFRAGLVAAIHESALALAESGRLSIDRCIADGRVAPQARTLFTALMHELAANDLAVLEDDGGWRVEPEGFAASATIWNTLFTEAPAAGAELALLAEWSERLPAMLASNANADPRVAEANAEPVTFGSQAARMGAAALDGALSELARRWPASRPLRALIVGPSTSGALGRVRRSLAAVGDNLRITAATLGESGEIVVPRAGPAEPIGEQGFDLVVCAHALSRGGAMACARMAACVAPGGVVLALEPQPNLLWDLLFGADPAWWRASAIAEYPLSPLQGGDGWARRLALEGLLEVTSTGVHASPWSLSLIAARRPPTGPTAPAEARQPAVRVLGDVPAALRGALGDGVREVGPEAPETEGALADVHTLVFSTPVSSASSRVHAVVASLLTAVGDAPQSPVWVITRGAYGERPDPAEAAVWGAVRSFINETPGADVRLLDVDPALAAVAAVAAIVAELQAMDGETQIVRSPSGRKVLRLRQGLPPTAPASPETRLEIVQPGLLSSLAWSPTSATPPPADGVCIDVKASALNFRDLMWAQALLPEEALEGGFAGATLGLECAGVVVAVGEAVHDLRVGERVMAMAPQSLASWVTTKASAVVPLPQSLSFEAAATLPVALLTVLYALDHLARLEPGERVLVHGGAGAVGMAAIQFAKQRGAVVFATAGSPLKRAFARRLGADHVLDSRSLDFAADIRRLTGGEGVDVVLNSLNGEAMEASLGLLRPFGRFLELGKRDFYADTPVGLRPLRHNVTYFAVDADRLPVDRPALASRLLRSVLHLLERGEISTLPYRVFERSDVLEAFRLMQAGAHMGKLVIVPDRMVPPPAPPPRPWAVSGEGVHIVTGGVTGFGLATARWLVDQGARRLALIGRRGSETPGASPALQALRDAGADARIYACDVADRSALDAVLTQVRAEQGAVVGVHHAAAVIEDSLLSATDAAMLDRVFAAKLEGALNLDALTRDDPVEHFVLFSSATTVMGAPGQGAYVAANTGLEALAVRRAREGRPSLAVAWGPIADAGVLARDQEAQDQLARRLSVSPIAASDALDALPMMWASGAPVVAYAAVRWEGVRRKLAVLASPTFEAFAAEAEASEETDLAQRLQGMGAAEAKAVVRDLLIDEMSKILSCARERLDASRPLPELGMDSLMAVELRMVLESRLRINLPLLSLSESTTISSLAARIVKSVRGGDGDWQEAAARHEAGVDGFAPPPTDQLTEA